MSPASNSTDAIERVAAIVAAADTTVALTGAGISTPSGVPDFRGEDGMWEGTFDPEALHRRRFERDPAGFWADRLALHEALFGGDVGPNPAHHALAALEDAGHLEAVITQNTDGLHRAADSDRVLELHGNASRAVCVSCGRHVPADEAFAAVRNGRAPPRCPACEGPLKPDVVLFGEALPEAVLDAARSQIETADALLVIGSSLTVEPAASLPRTAARQGATIAVLNFDPTPVDDLAAVVVREDVATTVPAIRERVCSGPDPA